MQEQQAAQNALERHIDLFVQVEDIQKEATARLVRTQRKAKVDGFRPGKVPMRMVEQMYGNEARSEALNALLDKTLNEAIRTQNLRVAGVLKVAPKGDGEAVDGKFEFEASVEVYPEIKLGDLSEKTIERPVFEVTQAEVDHTIEVLRKQRVTYTSADRAAADGDRLTVDFLGKKDGEPFQNGQANDFVFVLGAGQMLKDFETAGIGMKAGETKTFDLTFPEDYGSKDLAGKTVQFDITVKKVEAPVLPALDSDFAKALGIKDGSVETLQQDVKTNLEHEVARRILNQTKTNVMQALIEANPIDVPQTLIQDESQEMARKAQQDMNARGIKSKEMSVEPSWFVEPATRRIKLGLIVAEVVKANNIKVEPEQVKAFIESLAESYEDPQDLVRWYYAQPERTKQAEAVVLENNVVDWALTQAKVVDKAVSFDELMNRATGA